MVFLERFRGRVVVVTGGGSGIGAATARRFAAEGATAVVVGRTEEKLDRVVASAPKGTTIARYVADVGDEEAITQVIDAVADEYGRLDTLVNNAGVAQLGTVEKLDTPAWRASIATNLDGVFFASRAALPHLRAVGGSIVNVGSVSGLGGEWGMAAYSATKAAVANLTNAMAMDHGREGVRANAVHPSYTSSEVIAPVIELDAVREGLANRMPLGRSADPDEIAAVITFLASEDASFVTGAQLRVDGGVGATSGNPHLEF
ncbi:SDR family NAD(P)-dependent oxidoreductase [Pseudonocardia xinjiangensis]|uniref:SDR family NAD(P)-dependent oxidoreductase n=1 Tax=Pseudonocardia xinjiangensis TaxID=75289 RepID=UPI003D936303